MWSNTGRRSGGGGGKLGTYSPSSNGVHYGVMHDIPLGRWFGDMIDSPRRWRHY